MKNCSYLITKFCKLFLKKTEINFDGYGKLILMDMVNFFSNKLDLHLREKLMKCYIWRLALYGAETWNLGN